MTNYPTSTLTRITHKSPCVHMRTSLPHHSWEQWHEAIGDFITDWTDPTPHVRKR